MKLNKDAANNINTEELEKIDKPKRGRHKKTIDENKKVDVKEDNKDGNPMTPIINELKAKYGTIFGNTTSNGDIIIWKPLNRKEYKDIVGKTSLPENTQDINQMTPEEKAEFMNKKAKERDEMFYLREELVCLSAIVYPENAKEIIYNTAGLATILSEDILMHSGFVLSPTQAL